MSKVPATWLGSLILFVVILAGGLAADLGTKAWAFQSYYPYHLKEVVEADDFQPHWLIDGILGIQTSTNGGALFGMMQGFQAVFIVLSLLALVCVVAWLFVFQGWKDRLLVFCMGMISGGILGNLYDRMGWWHTPQTPTEAYHEVRDWIHFRLPGVPLFDPWPNFNIADSLLVVGVGIMLLLSFLQPHPMEENGEQDGHASEDLSAAAKPTMDTAR